MFRTNETIENQIITAENKLKKAKLSLDGLVAFKYLSKLWDTATFSNEKMNEIYPGNYDGKTNLLFVLDIRYFAENGVLFKCVCSRAKHFKGMDDSSEFPSWKKEAYKAAKAYQKAYDADNGIVRN